MYYVQSAFKLFIFSLFLVNTQPFIKTCVTIQIFVNDVNDNCPIISPTEFSSRPEPVLQVPPLVTFASTDADSGENGRIHYVVSAVTEE